jgi:hypothetical protein
MPRGLPHNVKLCLNKSTDSALLAVELYNKPAIKFKSGGYIVLMVIACTSLFHAIFYKRGIKPYYKDALGHRFLRVDNDFKYWELKQCLIEYFKTDTNNPIRKNLEFFIKIRNKVEHKSLPEIDSNIFGECQALLFNFDRLLDIEFGSKYCIRESLTFSLQLFPSYQYLKDSFEPNKDSKEVLKFIEAFRSSVSNEIYESGQYAFKAFLVQVANHQAQDTLPVQFLPYDKLTEDEKNNVKRVVTLIKVKKHETVISNKDLLKPGEIVKRIQIGLGNLKIDKNGKLRDKFVMDTHTRCWKKYKIRPETGCADPEQTNKDYCVYDEAHEDYLYKPLWVDFLIKKLKNEDEYNSLFLPEQLKLI